MTGLVFTISLLAAFQADAALPAASGAIYLSGMHRNGAAIERLRSLLPAIPDPPKVNVRKPGAPLFARTLPQPTCPAVPVLFSPTASVHSPTPVSTAPIRGPDSV